MIPVRMFFRFPRHQNGSLPFKSLRKIPAAFCRTDITAISLLSGCQLIIVDLPASIWPVCRGADRKPWTSLSSPSVLGNAMHRPSGDTPPVAPSLEGIPGSAGVTCRSPAYGAQPLRVGKMQRIGFKRVKPPTAFSSLVANFVHNRNTGALSTVSPFFGSNGATRRTSLRSNSRRPLVR